ncbi:stalk domain-containing protein [Paenibacillus kobensis]|uniref:stalk domain-containing protein n=1 Tax=Paenibacillus kobensis TaxID=59841 RepID=UPI000FD92AAC|nr:stalk domain-containing protein [Paenibacillus kobensis]
MRSSNNENRQTNNRGASKLIIVTLGGALLLQTLQFGTPAVYAETVQAQQSQAASTSGTAAAVIQAANAKLTLQKQNMIASGVNRLDYEWTPSTGSGTVNLHVIEVDLTNPYVQLNAISGKNNTVTNLNNVLNMAKETGAVAAINGDVFQTGSGTEHSPMGPQITSGTMMSGPMELKGMYAFGLTKDKVPSIDLYSFDGLVTAADGTTFPIRGMNESAYRTEPDKGYSHTNSIYVYTSAWTAATRPQDSSSTPTEVLVQGGIVQQIVDDGTTLPMQPPADGYILRAHGTGAKFIREHLQVGSPVTSDYSLVSQTTGAKTDAASFQMMVGGHTILVDQGKAATFSRDISGVSGASAVYRTAVGYTKDSKKVLILTAEGTSTRNGMSLKELQESMVALGVWKGVDMDGGGSTTMVERPLGEFDLKTAHPTTGGTYLRPVANGIGVFSTAPQGKLAGLLPGGPTVLFIGQSVPYSVKAYDSYYNPVDASTLQAQWKTDGSLGMFTGSSLTALKSGSGKVQVTAAGVTGEQGVTVIGADQIASMSIDASGATLDPGAKITASLKITTKDGHNYTIPSELVKWEYKGFTAEAGNGGFTVKSVSDNAAAGYAIARYDGFPAMLTLTKGSAATMWETFEKVGYGITFQGTEGASGSVVVVTGLEGKAASSQGLQLTYDFTSGIGSGKTLAAYAALGDSGRPVSGTPTGLKLDVYGDQSFNWLRMEVKDANGKLSYIDLAKSIDWTGWKTLTVDLTSYGLTSPVTVKRLYVANIAQGQDERAVQGSVIIDDMTMLYPPAVPETVRPAIKLTINKTAATVNGNTVKLDAAPIALSGVTYLPLRFIADSMGAQVEWDQAQKKVTVIRGNTMLELRIGSTDLVVNGVRQPAAAEPILRGGRTLVPLRLISEQLGLSVGWEQTTKTVTIK